MIANRSPLMFTVLCLRRIQIIWLAAVRAPERLNVSVSPLALSGLPRHHVTACPNHNLWWIHILVRCSSWIVNRRSLIVGDQAPVRSGVKNTTAKWNLRVKFQVLEVMGMVALELWTFLGCGISMSVIRMCYEAILNAWIQKGVLIKLTQLVNRCILARSLKQLRLSHFIIIEINF